MARNRWTPVAALLVVPALLACGCGGDEGDKTTTSPSPTPEQQVRAAWRVAAVAAASGNGAGFCPRVSVAGRAKLTAATQLPCEDAVRLLGARLTPADRQAITAARITAVSVTGDDAVVRYVTTPALADLGFTGRTELRRVGGRWLLQGT